jgi:hypothetical protein
VVDDGPVGEAFRVTQVAQVVAVAPQLGVQLWVADRRAGGVLIHRMPILRQPRREVAQMCQHLQRISSENAVRGAWSCLAELSG